MLTFQGTRRQLGLFEALLEPGLHTLRRSPGQEESSSPSARGGTASQEILETLKQSKTNIRELLQESAKERESIRKELPVSFHRPKEDLGKMWRAGKGTIWDWASWCSVAEEEEESWVAQAGGQEPPWAAGMVWKGSIRAMGGQRGGTRQLRHPCHQKVTAEPGLLGLILPQTTLELVCCHLPPCSDPAQVWPQQSRCSPGLSISLPVPWCTAVPHKRHHRLCEMIRNTGEKPQ